MVELGKLFENGTRYFYGYGKTPPGPNSCNKYSHAPNNSIPLVLIFNLANKDFVFIFIACTCMPGPKEFPYKKYKTPCHCIQVHKYWNGIEQLSFQFIHLSDILCGEFVSRKFLMHVSSTGWIKEQLINPWKYTIPSVLEPLSHECPPEQDISMQTDKLGIWAECKVSRQIYYIISTYCGEAEMRVPGAKGFSI